MSRAAAQPISARRVAWSTGFLPGVYLGTVERDKGIERGVCSIVLPFILGGEILFWILLLAGVSVRYLLGWRAVSTGLLIATPAVDLIIIALTYVDLAAGASSDFSHGLAAFYVGFSIVFGPEIITRIDRRFARRHTDLAEHELPEVPQHSSLVVWCRCLIASGITVVLLGLGMVIAGWSDSFWLLYWIIVAVSTAVLWLFIGPVRDRIRRRGARSGESSAE